MSARRCPGALVTGATGRHQAGGGDESHPEAVIGSLSGCLVRMQVLNTRVYYKVTVRFTRTPGIEGPVLRYWATCLGPWARLPLPAPPAGVGKELVLLDPPAPTQMLTSLVMRLRRARKAWRSGGWKTRVCVAVQQHVHVGGVCDTRCVTGM